jgi:hypothetical protein
MKFCTKCGRSLIAGAKFCTGCGASLPPESLSVSPPTAEVTAVSALPETAGEPALSDPTASAGLAPADVTAGWALPETGGQAPAAGGSAPGPAAPPRPGPPQPTGLPQLTGPPQATGRQRPWLHGQRATAALVAVAVLIAGGVIAGVEIAGQHGRTPAAGHASRPQTGPASAPAAASASSASVSASAGSASAAPASSAPPSAPAAAAGAIRVALQAKRQAGAAAVAVFLASYFAAIKSRNYSAYAALFVPGAVPDKTAAQFRTGYRSTSDSDVELVSLSASSAGLAAAVTFRSHQSSATSITHTACTDWGITFYLQTDGISYLIGAPPAGYRASYQPCP